MLHLLYIFYQYPVYLYRVLPDTWSEHPRLNIIYLLNNILFWSSLYIVNMKDPGYLKKNTQEYQRVLKTVGHEQTNLISFIIFKLNVFFASIDYLPDTKLFFKWMEQKFSTSLSYLQSSQTFTSLSLPVNIVKNTFSWNENFNLLFYLGPVIDVSWHSIIIVHTYKTVLAIVTDPGFFFSSFQLLHCKRLHCILFT